MPDPPNAEPLVVTKDDLFVPPTFKPPLCSYPPYCSSKATFLDMNKWRVAKVTVAVTAAVYEEKDLVEKWVLQLVRGELGEHLGEAEKTLKRTLSITLTPEAVELIREALRQRAH